MANTTKKLLVYGSCSSYLGEHKTFTELLTEREHNFELKMRTINGINVLNSLVDIPRMISQNGSNQYIVTRLGSSTCLTYPRDFVLSVMSSHLCGLNYRDSSLLRDYYLGRMNKLLFEQDSKDKFYRVLEPEDFYRFYTMLSLDMNACNRMFIGLCKPVTEKNYYIEQVAEFNTIIEKVCKETGAYFLDICNLCPNGGIAHSYLNTECHRLIYDSIIKWMGL